ncbi:unnamed protein product [Fraxinus pennsylvanica]|uniref:HMA domain-containing protein n=1 Tax=Fraxinus pennsylvanica TaxID=56036 RepID=A0AAD2DSX2_9LAMI|nr:unnamed protein product [Fraxinus pennsylvanica]
MTLPEMEKPLVTEIQVRMDCSGCVQKIKKALHGINDPHKIAKAIKKTRRTVIICSDSEPSDDHSSEPAPGTEGGAPPATEGANQLTAETPTQAEAPKESLPVSENPPSDGANGTPTNQPPVQTSKPKDAEEIHVIHHHVMYQIDMGHMATVVDNGIHTVVHQHRD